MTAPADKAAVAAHVIPTSDPAVRGAWAWLRHDDGRSGLDHRTNGYRPAGTTIFVPATSSRVELAPGAYGALGCRWSR